jgi:hypothetical protein
MLPGIFGFAFDFGYGGLLALMSWCVIVMSSGFYVLQQYRSKRRVGNRKYLGREALLIGALTAFISQTLIGLFLFNRTMKRSCLANLFITISNGNGSFGYYQKKFKIDLICRVKSMPILHIL